MDFFFRASVGRLCRKHPHLAAFFSTSLRILARLQIIVNSQIIDWLMVEKLLCLAVQQVLPCFLLLAALAFSLNPHTPQVT